MSAEREALEALWLETIMGEDGKFSGKPTAVAAINRQIAALESRETETRVRRSSDINAIKRRIAELMDETHRARTVSIEAEAIRQRIRRLRAA